jgi:DNA-binding LacI/PurR family transcriptional regulator
LVVIMAEQDHATGGAMPRQGAGTREQPARRGVALATLARELGVSRTTISNAYNHPDQLSPALRTKILEAAERLGYPGPDPLAATLSRGRVGALGLLFFDDPHYPLRFAFRDPAHVLFLEGVADACGQAGHVGIDDRGGAALAARHLLELGHRRLGVVSAPLSPDRYEGPADQDRQAAAGYQVIRERLLGYRAAVEAAGLDWEAVPVEERRPYGQDAGRRAAAALLDRDDRPTALLAMSDEFDFGAMRAGRGAGCHRPRGAVGGRLRRHPAGRAGPPGAHHRAPAPPRQGRGRRRVAAPAGRHPAEQILPVELVVRASTATVG